MYKLYTLDNKFVGEFSKIPSSFVGILENDFGDKIWFMNGRCHRLDGPAVEWHDGTKEWYAYGELHRLDGPAVEHSNGRKYWYVDDKQVTELQCKCLYDMMKLKGLL